MVRVRAFSTLIVYLVMAFSQQLNAFFHIIQN